MNKELKAEVLAIIKAYKQEIYEQGDWWYGLTKHSINVHDCADYDIDSDEYGEPFYCIDVYELGANGLDDYSHWESLQPLTQKELLAL